MADKEKVFAEGLFVEAPAEGVPDFIKYKLSFKVAEFAAFLEAHSNNAGYVNLDIKVSTGGKPYAELNMWKPEKPASVVSGVEDVPPEAAGEGAYEPNPDDIPF